MFRQTLSAAVMLVVLTIITGFIYPLAMTGVAQAVFAVAVADEDLALPAQEIAAVDDRVVGRRCAGGRAAHRNGARGDDLEGLVHGRDLDRDAPGWALFKC